MVNDLLAQFAIILVLVLANGIFAGAEIALVAVRTTRLQERAEQGSSAARTALALKQKLEALLATVQVGITVVSATAAAVGGANSSEQLAPLVARVPWLAPYAETIALALVITLVSYLSIVLGELVPKSLALRAAESYSLLVARPLYWLSWLAKPIVKLLTASSNLVLRPLGDSTNFTEARYSPQELEQLVEEAKASGSLHPQAADIATRALHFPELTAGEVMVPRQDVAMLASSASMDDTHKLVIERPHTRFPVYSAGPDDIIGYVNIKDLATRSWQNDTTTLASILRPPFFVPSSKPAMDLLSEMQKQRLPLAIVVEEQGGLAGIVTLEDLIEELVGDIVTELARDAAPSITHEPEGSWVVDGQVPIREVNRSLDLDLPEEGEWNTLAGLFIGLAGKIPRAGERQTLPDGLELEVLDASPRRIRSMRIHPAPPPAATET
ncbi:MAG: hemolysin family protein [Polyangiales bacterium]